MVTGKEVKQIATGVGLGLLLDKGFELYWQLDPEGRSDTFPFIKPIEWLPPVDDWITAGIPAIAYLLTMKRSEKIKNVALGALLYSGGMFLHHTIYYVVEYLKTNPLALTAKAHSNPMIIGSPPTGSKDGYRPTPTLRQTEPEKSQALLV